MTFGVGWGALHGLSIEEFACLVGRIRMNAVEATIPPQVRVLGCLPGKSILMSGFSFGYSSLPHDLEMPPGDPEIPPDRSGGTFRLLRMILSRRKFAQDDT